MRLSDVKIGLRLQVGFVLVISLMIMYILMTHFSIQSQHRLLSRIIAEDNEKLRTVSDLTDIVFREAIELRNSIILSKRPEIEEKVRIIEAGRQEFRDVKAQLGKYTLTADETPLYERIFEVYRAMEPVTKKVADLARANRDTEALQLLVASGLPLQGQLTDTLKELAKHIREKQRDDLLTEARLYARKSKMDLIMGAALVALGILLAFSITRSITGPVLSLAEESKKLRVGDYNLSLPVDRKDEIGVLALALRDAIHELERRQRLEQELQFEILNKEKLAAVGQLVAGIVHNLKNPLTAIMANSKLLRRDRPEVAAQCDEMLMAAENMEEIIATVLQKTRQEQSGEDKPIDLNKVLTEGLRFLEANQFFKHQVTKNIELTEFLPRIRGRYSDFSQSFSNVIKNALDAMKTCDRKVLTVKTWHDEHALYVKVADTGQGIEPTTVGKLFEPFFSTKALEGEATRGEPAGTGLGLYMVKALLKRYGAEYALESKPGEGTSFVVKLPKRKNILEQ